MFSIHHPIVQNELVDQAHGSKVRDSCFRPPMKNSYIGICPTKISLSKLRDTSMSIGILPGVFVGLAATFRQINASTV